VTGEDWFLELLPVCWPVIRGLAVERTVCWTVAGVEADSVR